jgi:hypothetical protein
MIDELMDVRSRRDNIRELIVAALQVLAEPTEEIKALLAADAELTNEFRVALARTVRAAKERST